MIPLRGPAGATHPILQIFPNPAVTEFADTPALALTPYFRRALSEFACPLRCVRLMRLTPGSRIKTHSDYDLAFEQGVVRIHVPITTNPGVEFRLNDIPVVMAPGEAWYLRYPTATAPTTAAAPTSTWSSRPTPGCGTSLTRPARFIA